jgi:hypothetical protein
MHVQVRALLRAPSTRTRQAGQQAFPLLYTSLLPNANLNTLRLLQAMANVCRAMSTALVFKDGLETTAMKVLEHFCSRTRSN